MNVTGITNCLEILREGDNRHGDLAREGSGLHLHGSLLVRLAQLVRQVIVILGDLFNKRVILVVTDICKQFVNWSVDW